MTSCTHHLEHFGASLIVLNLIALKFVTLLPLTDSYFGVEMSNTSSSRDRDKELRAELCPGLSERVAVVYRYDNFTKKCYRGGDKGPCGENMIFYSDNLNEVYGICDCDTRNNERALIFHTQSNQCYFVFSQGYCKPEEWLIFNKDDLPACAPNPCTFVRNHHRGNKPNREYVPFRGRCMELGSKTPACAPNEVISFVRNQLQPVCAVEATPGVMSFSLSVPRLRCSPGSAQSILGGCKSKVRYNLS